MFSTDDPLARLHAPATAQARLEQVQGLVTARVDRIEDDGTYRLRYFGMNGQDSDEVSAPARVMMPMAGGRRGVHFLPEPGDEVVVGFHAGETSMPIILGALWNRDDRPPSQARQSTENNIRTIVSRSGHELTFDDTSGAQKVTLRTQGGHTVTLDDAPGRTKITIQSSRAHTVTLDDGPPGQISIQGPGGQIVMTDAGTVSVEATISLSLAAPTIGIAANALTLSSAVGTTIIDQRPFLQHEHTAGALVDPDTPTPHPISGISGPVV